MATEGSFVQQLPYGLYVFLDWLSIIAGCALFVCLAVYYICREITIFRRFSQKENRSLCNCNPPCDEQRHLLKIGFKKGRSSEILLHDYIIPGWFARFAFFYGCELFCLAVAIFWEVFIFDKTYGDCNSSSEYACFSHNSPASAPALDCNNETRVENVTAICFKFALKYSLGVSAVVGTVGIGVSAFVTVSWVILQLGKCCNKVEEEAKKCGYCTNCPSCGIICLCVVQVFLIVASVVSFAVVAITYHKSIPTESILQWAIVFLAVVLAFALPSCWIRPKDKKKGNLSVQDKHIFTINNRLRMLLEFDVPKPGSSMTNMAAPFADETEQECDQLINQEQGEMMQELEQGEIFYALLDDASMKMEIAMQDVSSKDDWPNQSFSRYRYKVSLNEGVKLNINRLSMKLAVSDCMKPLDARQLAAHTISSDSIVTVVVEELEMLIKMKIESLRPISS